MSQQPNPPPDVVPVIAETKARKWTFQAGYLVGALSGVLMAAQELLPQLQTLFPGARWVAYLGLAVSFGTLAIRRSLEQPRAANYTIAPGVPTHETVEVAQAAAKSGEV